MRSNPTRASGPVGVARRLLVISVQPNGVAESDFFFSVRSALRVVVPADACQAVELSKPRMSALRELLIGSDSWCENEIRSRR